MVTKVAGKSLCRNKPTRMEHDRYLIPPERWLSLPLKVLSVIDGNNGVTQRAIAVRLGLAEAYVCKVIALLVAAGYLESFRSGRRNHYRIGGDMPVPSAAGTVPLREVLALMRRAR